jgi:hypothetical protein
MKKIKITETQKRMLESTANAKLKLTESDIPRSQSPSAKVTNSFKQSGADKIKGMKVEGLDNNEVSITELTPKVLEFLKQLYTNPTKEGLDPFWETIDISWDELIELLTELKLIKSVKGGYRLQKLDRVGPSNVVRIVTKLIHKLVNDKTNNVDEISNQDIKKSLSNQLVPKPKTGKTRAELLAVIAAKRAESQKITADREANRDIENNASIVDESDWWDSLPDHPANRVDNTRQGARPKSREYKIVWYHQETAIFEKGGKYYTFNVESADRDEYAEYADREEIPMGRDEDGFMDVEYGDWELDGEIVDAYVNDNIQHLSFGKGFDDWENGVEMVEMDNTMVQELIGLAKYIKGQTGENLLKLLSSMNLEEVSSTGSVGGSYVGNMSTGAPISRSNVPSEMKSNIDEVDGSGPIKSDILTSMTPFIKHSSMLFWLSNERKLKSIVDKIVSLGDDEWMLMVEFIVKALQGAETYIEKKQERGILDFKHSINGLSEFYKHFSNSLGEATTTLSVGGDSGTFAFDAPVGDGDKFWTAGNKMNKKSVTENAKTDTQYPNGEFVKFDDCTKLNNNKVAQNGGCSTGAIDNVVKTKTSKNSVISDSSIYESVAKATGRTIEEVKAILANKINKSN